MRKFKDIIGKNIGWAFWIVIIIAGIWILAGDNNSNYVEETNLTLDISQLERDSTYNVPKQPLIPDEESSYTPNNVYVKYRSGLVDIGHPRWEYLNTSKSSLVRGAWYDDDNQYMIINLSGTNYHYCSMPKSTWTSFKSVISFGTFYNSSIKGRYDCRIYPVPQYEEDIKSGLGSILPNITIPNSGGGYRFYSKTISDVYIYDPDRCSEGSYCYGEDQYGNEIEIYVYDMSGGYGYGEDNDGNEVGFYYDHPRIISDVYIYDDCEEGDYCYGEDEYGNEIEVYIYEMDDGYGYGEDDDGNEIEFYYDDY